MNLSQSRWCLVLKLVISSALVVTVVFALVVSVRSSVRSSLCRRLSSSPSPSSSLSLLVCHLQYVPVFCSLCNEVRFSLTKFPVDFYCVAFLDFTRAGSSSCFSSPSSLHLFSAIPQHPPPRVNYPSSVCPVREYWRR